MVERVKTDTFQISVITGASLGHDVDKILCEAGITKRRMPFQVDTILRAAINRGEVMFIDQHLSETVEQLRSRLIAPIDFAPIDFAVVEALAIREDSGIIPTTSIGNTASFAIFADKVIVEINTSTNLELEGLNDVYIPTHRPTRVPIIIENCVNPSYRDKLRDYFKRAVKEHGGQTSHLLDESFSWHQ